jgi:hypothetical protein
MGDCEGRRNGSIKAWLVTDDDEDDDDDKCYANLLYVRLRKLGFASPAKFTPLL